MEPLDVVRHLRTPAEVWDGRDPCPIPDRHGVYGCYLSGLDKIVPVASAHEWNGRYLLYVGVGPSRASSRASLRKRVRQHWKSNASGSTLRRTLGALLADSLGLTMRRVGRTERFHYHADEPKLTDWMFEHARFAWAEVGAPWSIEGDVIRALDLPLNIDHNRDHAFVERVSSARAEQRARARALPVVA